MTEGTNAICDDGARRMHLAPGTRLGRYEVRSLLGAGGMGEVYLAHDTTLRRAVAIKVLPNDVMFDGFKSRWMMPWRCARSSASAISMAYLSVSSRDSGLRTSRSASVSPCRYCITRKSIPFWYPTS